jgi:hypothetical protein
MTRGRLLTLLALAVLVGILVWSTVSAQRAECRVCVEFSGQRNCATATGTSQAEASRSAQNTACGPLARGMDESIACSNRPPVSVECKDKK